MIHINVCSNMSNKVRTESLTRKGEVTCRDHHMHTVQNTISPSLTPEYALRARTVAYMQQIRLKYLATDVGTVVLVEIRKAVEVERTVPNSGQREREATIMFRCTNDSSAFIAVKIFRNEDLTAGQSLLCRPV
jgi:hypothetical protein